MERLTFSETSMRMGGALEEDMAARKKQHPIEKERGEGGSASFSVLQCKRPCCLCAYQSDMCVYVDWFACLCVFLWLFVHAYFAMIIEIKENRISATVHCVHCIFGAISR